MLNISTGGLSADALVDCIKRAESKINRRVRLREMETLTTDTYTTASRFMDLPAGYVELLSVWWKIVGAEDNTYEEVDYVAPARFAEFYGDVKFVYTLRDRIEFNNPPTADYTIQMHYLKAWDIATDTTNWLLTTYPDCYLYGACMEAAVHIRDVQAGTAFKALFEESLVELDELSERGRDDAELDVSDLALLSAGHHFNILRG